MKYKCVASLLLISVFFYISQATEEVDSYIERIVFARRNICLATQYSRYTGNFAIDYSNILIRAGINADQFMAGTADYIRRKTIVTASSTNREDRLNLIGAIALLGRYGSTNDIATYIYVITNSTQSSAIESAAYHLLRSTNDSRDLQYCVYSRLKNPTEEIVSGLKRGLSMPFLSSSYDAQTTNRMLYVLQYNNQYSPRMYAGIDAYLCRWWQGYSTSSNRYQMVMSALMSVPPPSKTNYLNEVRAELESLPAGTMQQISTNFFYNIWE